ncbi:MAG: hypothetical protein KAJ32_05380 [Gammaproteobacteria bacterium]|nr:hypothetical protein [Gammaproteobacteria bacterium]
MKILSIIIFISISCASTPASADGNSVDKVYHPYVLPMETEVEWRAIFQNDDNDALDNQQLHRLGIGSSFIEYWFTEIYLIGEKSSSEEFDVNAIEIEAKVQLTEQGEYAADWGLLFELESEIDNSAGELATALLVEKEWGRWVGALNFFIEYEWGDEIKNEIETVAATQLRYRFSRLFEPAVEFYTNQDTLAIGPAVMGNIRLGIAKKIHWEFGVIFGLQSNTPDQTIRALIEYEF